MWLLRTFAQDLDRHRAAREAREQERRDQRRIAERLVEEIWKSLDEVPCSTGIQDLLVVLRAERLRHTAGVDRFVEGRILEADREGLEAASDVPGGEGRDGARVDAAGEKDAQRHVADEVLADGEVQGAAEPLDCIRDTDRVIGAKRDR